MTNHPELPPLPEGYTYRLELGPAATSRLLRKRPIHRWFYFPHSYSPELVEAVLDEWKLQPGSWVLDPFVGAGTTLLTAQERGLNATGLDLSPLSVRVSNAKLAQYPPVALEASLSGILTSVDATLPAIEVDNERLVRAFSPGEFSRLHQLRQAIVELEPGFQDFFWLAFLATAREFSRAVADGGWYRWVEKPDRDEYVAQFFEATTRDMISELPHQTTAPTVLCEALLQDARAVHQLERQFDALITSPPYPNRHDYTRVYHIELLLMNYTEDDIFDIRYGSLRSHVEAKEPLPQIPPIQSEDYLAPTLRAGLSQLPDTTDPRVTKMLKGYFNDLCYALVSASRSLATGARVALVVGNVRHQGVMFYVDEILREVGEQAGFEWTGTWVVRLRGNSAQQMARYGREPSRESVVFFRKP